MMKSSNLSVEKRRRTYVRLIGDIRNALNQALREEFDKRKLTRTGMAEALATNKSFVTRKLNGSSNMTLETLADLAYSLDRVVKVQLLSRAPMIGSNHSHILDMRQDAQVVVSPTPAASTDAGSARKIKVRKLVPA